MAERKQFLLRIDPGLWADLEAWAADDLRSVNGQIEYLAEGSGAAPQRAAPRRKETRMKDPRLETLAG